VQDRRAQTIEDFGEQWTHFRDNPGYHGSLELLADVIHPLLSLADFQGARVAEIGSGTGRIVRMLHQAGADQIIALEPSAAMAVMKENTADIAAEVEYLTVTGDQLPPSGDLDLVIAIGVLHHIPDPQPVVRAARAALRPGGRFLIWVYGTEGNELYLSLFGPIRRLTTRLPHRALLLVSRALYYPLAGYMWLCQKAPPSAPLAMRSYVIDHLSRLTPGKVVETIYDQLNPHEARYYTRGDAEALLRDGGFRDVRSHHRHGYSWTVIGTR
jgi:hypothetical protein